MIDECIQFIEKELKYKMYRSRVTDRLNDAAICLEKYYTRDEITKYHILVYYYFACDKPKSTKSLYYKHLKMLQPLVYYIMFVLPYIKPQFFDYIENRVGKKRILSINYTQEDIETFKNCIPQFRQYNKTISYDNIIHAASVNNEELYNHLITKDYVKDFLNTIEESSNTIEESSNKIEESPIVFTQKTPLDDISTYIEQQQTQIKMLSDVQQYVQQLEKKNEQLRNDNQKYFLLVNKLNNEKKQHLTHIENLKTNETNMITANTKLKETIKEQKKNIINYHDQVEDLEIRLSEKERIITNVKENMKNLVELLPKN